MVYILGIILKDNRKIWKIIYNCVTYRMLYQALQPIHHNRIVHLGRISLRSEVHRHRFTRKLITSYFEIVYFSYWKVGLQLICYGNEQYLISRVCDFDLKVETFYKY